MPQFDPSRVPASRVQSQFGSNDPRDLALHSFGKSFCDQLRAFRNDFSNAPDLVVHATDEDDIARAFALASKEGAAIVPFGGGTSVTGGVECPRTDRPVISLDLRSIDRVTEVDDMSRVATIGAGALGPVLEAQLARHGLTLRHFPQSFEHSTLGGWIATRAGGHFATLYTHIDDLTQSVRMMTPTGGVLETRKVPASGAGPDPNRFVLGSEGAFGVITRATMRVFRKPRFRSQCSVKFPNFAAGVEATRNIAQSGLYPTNCRLLDEREALINGVTFDGSAVLVLAFESHDHDVREPMERALKLAIREGGLAEPVRHRTENDKDLGAAEQWKSSFLRGPHMQSALISMGVLVDTFEGACTWNRFAHLQESVTQSVMSAIGKLGAKGSLSCRFTHVYPDGPAPYWTFIAVGGNGDLLDQWRAVKTAASDALLECGATITHHHAVGRTHAPWYTRERPTPFGAMLSAVKKAVDPAGIMNPGVLGID
jgi:alkyldihydroxyacetonephosphate synthase